MAAASCKVLGHTVNADKRLSGAWVIALAGLVFLSSTVLAPAAEVESDSLHQPFDLLLRAHVADGQVDYPSIAADRNFHDYVEFLARANPAALESREEQLAFWINAYNALAIKGIIDGRSPSSLFGRLGFFKTTTYEVGGKTINLYDLEREVIIPLGEPRIHFAIVCASFSCPMLRSEAYTAARLEEQLELNTRQFINDATRNRFDRDKKIAHLSKIFDWFAKDFEQHSGSALAYVANYVADPELARELRAGGYKIKHLKYDWSLNGAPPESS